MTSILALALSLVLGGPAEATPLSTAPSTVTLPCTLDHNRMIVEAEFLRPDGSIRKAKAWVDTGNPDLLVAESLARDLGLDLSALGTGDGKHSVDSSSPAPGIRLGGMPLDVQGLKPRIRRGSRVMPGLPAEANIPARALRRCHVVLDYPARRFTLAKSGSLKPKGLAIPCRVNAETGLFLVVATLDGEAIPLGVDNGSAGTWVSENLTAAWATRHPDWPNATGAAGSANFFGFDFEAKGTLMRLPELGIGPLKAKNIGLLGLEQGFFDWYSQKSAEPVQGFLGANLLRGFRLEIDFPNQMTYWEQAVQSDPDDLEIVGLSLRPEGDGRMVIAGVVRKNGTPCVEGLRAGDVLLRVDGQEAQGATTGAVITALRGKPGQTRSLIVDRDGKIIHLEALVTRLP